MRYILPELLADLPRCLVQRRLVLPSLGLPRLALPRLVLRRLALPRLALPRLVLPSLGLPRLALPRLVTALLVGLTATTVLEADSPPSPPRPVEAPTAVARTLAEMAARTAPTVVRIHAERYAPTRLSKRHTKRDLKQWLQRLFERDRPGTQRHPLPDQDLFRRYHERPSGPCSGVLVRPDGLVLTSKFNVEGPVRSITVELHDGRMFPARLLGWDANLDVAALQLDHAGATLPALRLQPRREPVVGSYVVVVGASWGRVPYTANMGTVSALDRLGGSSIQLNVDLNYGNTGGAVLDLKGHFVGLTGHVRPLNRTGLNAGVGFATGVARLLEALPDLEGGKRKENTAKPFLGIRPREDRAGKRVFIEQVVPGSGADEAGVRAGDVLISLAGTPIQELNDMILALSRTRVGQEVPVVIGRGGAVRTLTARLGTEQ